MKKMHSQKPEMLCQKIQMPWLNNPLDAKMKYEILSSSEVMLNVSEILLAEKFTSMLRHSIVTTLKS